MDRIQPTYTQTTSLVNRLPGSKQIKGEPSRTVPSPPQARIRRFGTFRYNSNLENSDSSAFSMPARVFFDVFILKTGLRSNYGVLARVTLKPGGTHASRSPPCDRSNTCRGFKIHINICNNLAP